MALSILDGNQSATTLSTILSSGQHITAHTVVSLGTQAITDIVNATSAGLTNTQLRASAVTVGGTVTVGNSVTISSLPAISGTVTANVNAPSLTAALNDFSQSYSQAFPVGIDMTGYGNGTVPISGTVTIGSALPAGTNRIGVVTIGAGTVTIGAGTAQIGTVTASLQYSTTAGQIGQDGLTKILQQDMTVGYYQGDIRPYGVPIAFVDTSSQGTPSFRVVGNSGYGLPVTVTAGYSRIGVVTIGGGTVTIGAGTAQIGSVTASISNFPATQPVSLASLPALVAGTAQIGSVTVGNTVTIAGTVTANPTGTQTIAGSVTIGAGTSQIGAVTASISNSVTIASLPAISGTVTVNLSISSTAITSGSFTSLTSAILVPANTARKMATVYNLGAGQLFVNAGVTATTLGGGFMVALSSGDFYECPYTTTTLSAIFATAGTASWVSH